MLTFMLLGVLTLQSDPVKDIVLKFLASYGGIIAGVAFLVSGLKWAFKPKVEGREPVFAITLTFVLGTVAKLVMPGIYGDGGMQAWILHEVVLAFCSIGSQQFHDKLMNPLLGKLGGGTSPPELTDEGKKGGGTQP